MACKKHKLDKSHKITQQQTSCTTTSIREFSISQDVSGVFYTELVRFCARHSCFAIFVLTMPKSENSRCKDVLQEIVSLGGTIETVQKWPGTIRYGKSFAEKYTVRISPEIVDLLEESAKTLFSWLLPKLPEDICFLRRDSSVFLYSTTHENLAVINITESELHEWKENNLLSKIKIDLIK